MFYSARKVLNLFAFLLVVAPAWGGPEQEPILQYSDRFHPETGYGGMVVSQERLASEVGAAILGRGGNAVDAAVATGFALAVTLPQAGNLGGGGFMLIHLAESGKTIALDYREMAPAAAHRDFFLDEEGNADSRLSRFSGRASGVPGTVAGLVHAQKTYGNLKLKEVIQPAVRLAEKGFVIPYPLAWSLERAGDRLSRHPASARYFFRENGEPLEEGHLWRQADLANTLKRIAATEGRDFYEGKTARLIVEEMQRVDGVITMDDLKNYEVVERTPVTGNYRGYQVASMPPPSSGGVHLIQMLNILEGWDLAALGLNSAGYIHRLVESMRRAYADRSEYLGDPDFVEVPLRRLTSEDYAARLREGIDPDAATPSSDIKPGLGDFEESPQTTHFSVWDSDGNVVSNTYTLNFSYGNGISVSGAGFLMNNEMDDFSAKPGVPNAYGLIGAEANAIEPGKRPLSSMTPAIVFRDGEPVLATGSPGGSRIITAVLQMVLNTVDFEMNVAEATAAPRIHHQWLPDRVYVENGISRDTLERLKAMGHDVEETPYTIGKTQSVSRQGDFFLGASDYRWPGGGAISPSLLE